MVYPKNTLIKLSVMALVLTLSACNEQEFYEKSYLEGAGVERDSDETPRLPSTDPSDFPEDNSEEKPPESNQGPDTGDSNEADSPNSGDTTDSNDDQGESDSETEDEQQDETDEDSNDTDTDGGQTDSDSDSGSDSDPDSGSDTDSDSGSDEDSDSDDETEEAQYESVRDVFVQKSQGQEMVDIVWVVDDSGSMGDEQDALAYNFNAFILDFLNQDIDFKMGITTTDATPRGDGKWRGHYKHLTSEAAKKNEQKFLRDFKRTIKVGTRGSPREMGLHTGLRFLERYANRSQPFLRDDAYLIVVILSDEEDQSSDSVDEYIEKMKNFKKNDGLLKVYSIVTKEKTNYKWETVGSRYVEASEKTNGVSSHIKEDFYHILRNMGTSIVNLTKSFALSQRPHQDQVRVYIDGEEQVNGWSFEAETSALRFDDDSLPRIGAEISVEYDIVVK